MAQLQGRNDVQWKAVKEAAEEWDHEAEGLTQAATAVIMLAVTAATGGAGGLFGSGLFTGTGLLASAGISVTNSVAMAAINAGFTTIVSRATVSLINNKGDLGAVLQELGSSDFIKSLATSVLTAGILSGLPPSVLPVGKGLSIAQKLQAGVVRSVISSGLAAGIQGADFGDTLINSLKTVGVNTVLAQTQIVIGDLTDGIGAKDLPVANLIAHALAGGLASKALGGDFAAGAASALASAGAAQLGLFDGIKDDRNLVSAVSQLIGAAAALVAGGDGRDVNIGANIASSAALNNYLNHSESLSRARAKEACLGGNQVACGEVDRLNTLDKSRDLLLASSCENASSSQCAVEFSKFYKALVSFKTDPPKSYATQADYIKALGSAHADLEAEFNQNNALLAKAISDPQLVRLVYLEERKTFAGNNGATLRFFAGIAGAGADTIRGLHQLADTLANNPEELSKVITAILLDPSLIPEAMWAPFKERIDAGDLAGAAGYAVLALPEAVAGTKGTIAAGKGVITLGKTGLSAGADFVQALRQAGGGKRLPDIEKQLADKFNANGDNIIIGDGTRRSARLPQDIKAGPIPPKTIEPLADRRVGTSATQNAAMQADRLWLEGLGAKNIRIDQQIVNGARCRVGICRPDLQATLSDGRRIHIEYDRTGSTRGPSHARRILSNDPNAIVILRTVD